MTEERQNYPIGPTDSAEPPLTIEDLVTQAHANRQGIPSLWTTLIQKALPRINGLPGFAVTAKAKRIRPVNNC